MAADHPHLMSSANNVEAASQSSPPGFPTSEVTPRPMQSNSERPVSKHWADMRQIRLDYLAAWERKERGEITHEEFMRITRECVKRKRAREEASLILCERAKTGEVSFEEYSRECGFSDGDWEMIRPDIDRKVGILVANTRRIRARSLRNRGSRGH
ncbi:hypothetical protein EVG20_g6473 [Dentipellis fragilis]|uniref:Uncharacterized protein n=1 Tax=Dentipellis fragilis TaxID=205917 RepID=A0A4Y9YM93_9AGAM|nr:hypothetical protein EVG20_g6473 [Dentipellis fragilis]